MLIEFRVKNFRSFKDEQVFTMESEGEGGYFKETNIKKYPYVTTVSGFYGANGSGKSNIFEALKAMRHMVVNSCDNKFGEDIKHDYFCLSNGYENKPTSFFVKFFHNNILYSYSFAYNSKRILSENLEECNFNKEGFEPIFERYFDNEKNQDMYKNIDDIDPKWHSETLENMLALSKAPQRKLEKAGHIYDWFRENIFVAKSNSFLMNTTIDAAKKNKDQVVELLKKADLGLENFDISEKDSDALKGADHLPHEIKELIRVEETTDVIFRHKTDGTGNNKISLKEQSEGTKRFFGLSGVLLEVLKKGETLCIDEIDERLHPHLLAEIIELFKSPRTNPKGAQLIFAAHNTYLMDFLEREQIWFAEKDKTGATSLTSLWEYNIEDIEDFNKNYLLGRYNAVPHISTLMPYKSDAEGA